MNLGRIRALDSRAVTVTTNSGTPISVGRIQVSADGDRPRVEITFKTPLARCSVLLLPSEVQALLQAEDTELYRHVLPAGDKLWLDTIPIEKPAARLLGSTPEGDQPVVETYPLPPSSRLGAPAAKQPNKTTPEVHTVKQAPTPNQKTATLTPIKVIPAQKLKP